MFYPGRPQSRGDQASPSGALRELPHSCICPVSLGLSWSPLSHPELKPGHLWTTAASLFLPGQLLEVNNLSLGSLNSFLRVFPWKLFGSGRQCGVVVTTTKALVLNLGSATYKPGDLGEVLLCASVSALRMRVTAMLTSQLPQTLDNACKRLRCTQHQGSRYLPGFIGSVTVSLGRLSSYN